MKNEVVLVSADPELVGIARSALSGLCDIAEVNDTRSAMDGSALSEAAALVIDGDLPVEEVASVVRAAGDSSRAIVAVRQYSLELLSQGGLIQVPRDAIGRLLAGVVERLLAARSKPAATENSVPADRRVEEMIKAIRQVRHDINNPLTSIMAETQLLLMDSDQLSEEQQRGLETVESMTGRIRDLTQLLHEITAAPEDA